MSKMHDRILLIGQAPGPNSDPDYPLFPRPAQMSGGRLMKLMGIQEEQYLRYFQRMNLLYEFPGEHVDRARSKDKWPEARARAAALAVCQLLPARKVIFVGRNVSNAFGWTDLAFCTWASCDKFLYECAVIPHPSGRNHWLHKPENREITRNFFTLLFSETEAL